MTPLIACVAVAISPPAFQKGDELYFQCSIKGTFTSYGGKVTKIDKTLNNYQRILIAGTTMDGDPRFKVGFWWNSMSGEPIYVYDVNFDGTRNAFYLSQFQRKNSFLYSDEIPLKATSVYGPDQWFFMDFSSFVSEGNAKQGRSLKIPPSDKDCTIIDLVVNESLEGKSCRKIQFIGDGAFASKYPVTLWVEEKSGMIRKLVMTRKLEEGTELDGVKGEVDAEVSIIRLDKKPVEAKSN